MPPGVILIFYYQEQVDEASRDVFNKTELSVFFIWEDLMADTTILYYHNNVYKSETYEVRNC